jgi:hypothetical protein
MNSIGIAEFQNQSTTDSELNEAKNIQFITNQTE